MQNPFKNSPLTYSVIIKHHENMHTYRKICAHWNISICSICKSRYLKFLVVIYIFNFFFFSVTLMNTIEQSRKMHLPHISITWTHRRHTADKAKNKQKKNNKKKTGWSWIQSTVLFLVALILLLRYSMVALGALSCAAENNPTISSASMLIHPWCLITRLVTITFV